MVAEHEFGELVQRWAEGEPSVRALVQIGSRVRAKRDAALAADQWSDWDFQIVAKKPEIFSSRAWVGALGAGEPLAYVARTGRLGLAIKVSAVFRAGECDFVVMPESRMIRAKRLLKGDPNRISPAWHGALNGLAMVLRDGHCVLKGSGAWGGFFQAIATRFPLRHKNRATIVALAEGYVCDWISTRSKIDRGEFLAAQRWLHCHLAEVNFQLLHELRQRRGEPTFPDARRIERLNDDWRSVEISAVPTRKSLRAAIERSAATLRELMQALDPDWRWPLV